MVAVPEDKHRVSLTTAMLFYMTSDLLIPTDLSSISACRETLALHSVMVSLNGLRRVLHDVKCEPTHNAAAIN